jgi:hypothetical protein
VIFNKDCIGRIYADSTSGSYIIILPSGKQYSSKNPQEDWTLELLDVEAAFLNSELDMNIFIEWSQEMVELEYITQKEKAEYCIQLTRPMYGNIDS